MRNLNKIYRIRLSDFKLAIFELAKNNKIKPSDFIRQAIAEKAQKDFNHSYLCPF